MARKLSTSRGSTGLARLLLCGAAVSGIAPPKAKLTTTTLLVLRNSRLFTGASLRFARAQHSAQDSSVCAAPAEIPGQSFFDLLGSWVRGPREKRLCAHDHSIRA